MKNISNYSKNINNSKEDEIMRNNQFNRVENIHHNVSKTSSADTLAADILACKTGIDDIDSELQVFKPGEVTVLAARPAMGKTTVAMDIHKHILKNERANAIYIKGPCAIEDITGDQMVQFILQQYIGILIIDFAQIIDGQDMTLSDILSELRVFAARYGISILTCSQLLRDVEYRPDYTPTIKDLNPAVANNAHNVVLMVRESYYNDDKQVDSKEGILDEMEYIIARDSDNPEDRVQVDGPLESQIRELVENTMKLSIDSLSCDSSKNPTGVVVNVDTEKYQLQFFEDAISFKTMELKESIENMTTYSNENYSTICTVKVRIDGRIWLMRIGGMGEPFGDGSVIDCTACSGLMLEIFFKRFKSSRDIYD